MILYVMQDTSSIQNRRELYAAPGENPEPLSVLVENPGDTLRRFSRSEIFQKSGRISLQTHPGQIIKWGLKHGTSPIQVLSEIPPHSSPNGGTGLIIPEPVIKHYALREGDQVGIAFTKEGTLVIASVNGIEDPAIARSRPDINRIQGDYPPRPLPVEKYGDPDLRVITLLSPIGLGSSHWLIAPGGAGKTWLLVKMIRESVKLLGEIEKLHLVIGFIGDRPEDGSQYLDAIGGADPNRVEFYQSPWSDMPVNQIGMTKFVTRRARALAAGGKHVVLFFDSITRAVAADTAAFSSTDPGGMIKGGLLRSSLVRVVQGLFGIHGYFRELDSSLTIIGTALSGTESSEAVVEKETGDSSTIGIIRLLNNPVLRFPKVSVDSSQTYTRFPNGRDFRSEKQRLEMDSVKKLMWDKFPRAEEAQSRLVQYVEQNPKPKY